MVDRKVYRRVIFAVLLAAILLVGPNAAVSKLLGVTGRQALPYAFSEEPTVTVSIGSPTPLAYVGRYVTIEATVLASMGIAKVRSTAGGLPVGEETPPSTPTAWRYSVVWDSQATAEGTSTIEVAAEDADGRIASSAVQVRVDHTSPRITYTPTPSIWAFSPNGDGRRDTVAATIKVSETAYIRVTAHRGTAERTLLDVTFPRSAARFTWDGRMIPGGNIVPDGRYPIVVRVADKAGNTVVATQTAIVDRVKPRATWASLTSAFWPAKGQLASIIVNASDNAGGVEVGARVGNPAKALIKSVPATIRSGGRIRVTWNGKYLNGRIVYPGEYDATPTILDRAGNLTTLKARRTIVHAAHKPVTVFSVRTTKRVVALTFDDLYSAQKTNRILDILKSYKVKATFFPVGQAVTANPSVMRRIVAEGHILGNHSQSHPIMTRLSAAEQRQQLIACRSRLLSATGHTSSPWFRPPYGATNSVVAASAAAEEHPFIFMWDIDTLDWASPGVSRIIGSVTRNARPGSIVLMHGGPPQTPEALPSILRYLKAHSYRMVTLPELMWIGGYR
jgi:peptidoglycan/xylan/chitin deacetylase (PgdA/CDA1 family)